jgi:hypothetical protein
VSAALAAVPWWAWAILATLTGAVGSFVALCLRAPMDTDVWDGGEPREVRGIRVNPGREPW